jgi:predicted phosphohydrolase
MAFILRHREEARCGRPSWVDSALDFMRGRQAMHVSGWPVVLLGLGLGCATPTRPVPFAGAVPTAPNVRFAVAGDLQRTASVLEFWREQNDAEREQVVAAIARAQPDLLVLTGDCVFDGGSDAQWSAFDRLMAPLHATPAIAAFGNHEYWRSRVSAERQLLSRFPLDGDRHWFSVALGPLRLIVLDSNRSALDERVWASQQGWFKATLQSFDADPAVRGVVVVFHHPPFTNSTVTGDGDIIQRDLVPDFLQARKTLAMLNGHVHSYERFSRGGKLFVVSGGGGGPRAALETGEGRRHPDDLFVGPSLRSFHFAVYRLTALGLEAEVHALAKGSTQWQVVDRFTLPFPAP